MKWREVNEFLNGVGTTERLLGILKVGPITTSVCFPQRSEADAVRKMGELDLGFIGLLVELAHGFRHRTQTPTIRSRFAKLDRARVQVPEGYADAVSHFSATFGACLRWGHVKLHELLDAVNDPEHQCLVDSLYESPGRTWNDSVDPAIVSSTYQTSQRIGPFPADLLEKVLDSNADPRRDDVRMGVMNLAKWLIRAREEDEADVGDHSLDVVNCVLDGRLFEHPDWQFDVSDRHPYLRFGSTTQAIAPDGTPVFFVSHVDDRAKVAAVLAYNNQSPAWDSSSDRRVRLLELQTGLMHEFEFDVPGGKRQLLLKLSTELAQPLENVTIILDLETTGLDVRTMEVIERCFLDPFLNLVVSEGLVRPSRGIPLSQSIERLTGIHTADLCRDGVDSTDAFHAEVREFLLRCEKPALLAHNGASFDFAYLWHKGLVCPADAVWVDTLRLFKTFPSAADGSFRNTLLDCHTRITGKLWDGGLHRARADVEVIRSILHKCGIDSHKGVLDADRVLRRIQQRVRSPAGLGVPYPPVGTTSPSMRVPNRSEYINGPEPSEAAPIDCHKGG